MAIMIVAGFALLASGMEHLQLEQVKIGGEIGRRIDVTVNNNLLVVDMEKDFVAPFLEKSHLEGYVGLGKTIDAMARLAAYTKDERLIALKKKTVAAVLASQEADGYIGIMKPEARIAKLWDVHEMSYMVLALTNDYAYCGEQPSLEGARKLADYLLKHLMVEPRLQLGDLSPHMPDTGFEEALIALHGQCGDNRYLDAARNYRPLPSWHPPITIGRWGGIEGHAYAYIDKCLAQLRLNPTDSEPAMLAPTRDVMDFLLNKEGLVITGACGDHECWHNTQTGTTNLGETCTTAYLLRFWDELLRRSGDSIYGDMMERAIYNALFAAQSPDGRKIRYYAPFEAERAYHPDDTYCCPCNYRRAMADLPQYVFYKNSNGVLVNLYAPSEAIFELAQGKVKLTQTTDYPNSGVVKIRVDVNKPATFVLSVRVPRWCKAVEGDVNGEKIGLPRAPGYATIDREWKAGDVLTLNFPMDWRLVKGRRAQAGKVAIMRGPQVFTMSNKATVGKAPARLLTLDPASLKGPEPDITIRPDGMACDIAVWEAGAWYPSAKTTEATLTEFADPDGINTYFLVPNPNDERLIDDELIGVNPGI